MAQANHKRRIPMSKGVNKITLVGNLGSNPPEMRYTASGTPVANFSLRAGEFQTKDAKGEIVSETIWFKCTVWKKLAEVCCKYLRGGSHVYVEGRDVHINRYTGSDGKTYSELRVTVDFMKMLDKKSIDDQIDAETIDLEKGLPPMSAAGQKLRDKLLAEGTGFKEGTKKPAKKPVKK
jgi:single stranded DNA-binding protein